MEIRPYNNRIKVVPLSNKQKDENGFEVPSRLKKKEERHHEEKYINVEIVDVANDINLIKEWGTNSLAGTEPIKIKYLENLLGLCAVVETYALEEILINGETHYFVPLQSVVCTYTKEQ